MLKTDSHYHIIRWHDGAPDGCENIIETSERYRVEAGLAYINAACFPTLDGCDVTQNMMAALLKYANPHVFAFGGLAYPALPVIKPMPEGFRPEEQFRDLMAVGFDGIKMLEGKPSERRKTGVPLSDETYEPFLTCIENEGIPILWHVADPSYFWHRELMSKEFIDNGWCYEDDPSYLPYEAFYEEIYAVLRRHPKLTVTFAHLFFLGDDPNQLISLLDTYPNVCVDVTPGTELEESMNRSPALWRCILKAYADRVLLGTDNYTDTPIDAAKKHVDALVRFFSTTDAVSINNTPLVGIGLPSEAVQKIMYDNFHRRVGTTPRPIDRDALAAYIAKYLPLVTEADNRAGILAYCDKIGLRITHA